ncbi:hypothetical protein Bbelb_185690 [Branchiostoma belcheri]|nr:hypothetical protein Bbelb_185690 [Branchiostoma belcheri]
MAADDTPHMRPPRTAGMVADDTPHMRLPRPAGMAADDTPHMRPPRTAGMVADDTPHMRLPRPAGMAADDTPHMRLPRPAGMAADDTPHMRPPRTAGMAADVNMPRARTDTPHMRPPTVDESQSVTLLKSTWSTWRGHGQVGTKLGSHREGLGANRHPSRDREGTPLHQVVQPLDADGGINDLLKRDLKANFVKFYADSFARERNSKEGPEVKVDLTTLKPLHAR